MDTLINMPNYPKEDTKMRAESSKQAGGGPVATGLVAPARLGAETEYIGVLSDDAGGRQRTAANQIFTRLLRSCAAEKDAVRIPRTRGRLTIFKPFGHALKIRACQTNKNRRMYSDRICKTKASSTQGSFCKPINLIFCGGNAAFFIFSLPEAAEIRHTQSSAALFWERLYSSAVISILETAYSVCPL